MVFNKNLIKEKLEFSPTKVKNANNSIKPSTSGTVNVQGEDSSEIKVIVRVRPHNDREIQNNNKTIIEIVDDKMLIFDPKEKTASFFFHNVVQKGRDMLKKQNKQLQFIFDRVFDSASTNVDVFEGSTKNLISSLLDGYNCSVFAYGATGAGKTHTMLGNKEDLGITYRTVAELFSFQMSAKNVAILNKLKNGNLARLPSGHNNIEEGTDVAFKAMRTKERRGLMTTLPYYKPAIGKKPTPALPSTRVPW